MSDLPPPDALQKDAEGRILTVRGQQVMLDSDLAAFYGIETRQLNQRATRNVARFPEDFRFQLTAAEVEALTSQNRMSKPVERGGRRHLPWVYTAKGALAASGVIKSCRADEVAVAIPRAFEALARPRVIVNGEDY